MALPLVSRDHQITGISVLTARPTDNVRSTPISMQMLQPRSNRARVLCLRPWPIELERGQPGF